MTRHLFPALLFLMCLFIGYQAGMVLGTRIEARSDRLASLKKAALGYSSLVIQEEATNSGLPAVTLPNGQRSIVLIGADDLESGSPRLESIWLVSYVPYVTRLTFLPVYPGGSDPSLDANLAGLFHIVKEGERYTPDPAFLEALRSQIPWWSSYVVFDTVSFLRTIGGPSGNPGKKESNRQVTELPPHAWENPLEAQAGQAALYQRMCWQASTNDSGLEIEETIRQYPGRFLSDLEADQLVAEMVKLSEHIGAYACEFPTLNPR